eukprot:TRINITY_DN12784_c0_g1_i1.p1 TRINITY_DN12784_c0_g1~~TRINITY_DN12784_c0_g1_i1.p1  ORF type:complete len:406 (-),score=86.40 TRINITY_DN12784_c0_g1_i1:1061-2278(-)
MRGKRRREEEGIVYVTVKSARNLAPMDKGGTSDPYVILTTDFDKQKFKTKIIKKTLNPVWDQEFQFYGEPSGNLLLKIWDKDKWVKDDFLGDVMIPLEQAMEGAVDEWYTIENEPKTKVGEPGQIRIKLYYPSSTSANNQGDDIFSRYKIGKEIGRGGFSVVKLGTKRSNGKDYAIKIIEKSEMDEDIDVLRREIEIMKQLSHPYIISLEEVWETEDIMYLVMELVTGGELFDKIIEQKKYSERDSVVIIKQILEAIAYMHENGIAHRDLKPENILVTDSGDIKVTDFGLSKDYSLETLQTSCGTPDYVAPEVLKGVSYDSAVDIWSIGVITYILLCGFPPFYGSNDQIIFDKILRCDYNFPSPDWDNISQDAKDFISALLVMDSSERPTALDCLEAPWILENST